ncbi:methyl jasmonate esterase 1-like [Prosopis cineraria]|uniref:methyl jasmonate esterase 1-like n=1 Tax=Prosopis cineraria TaxID=364024 RepID=UPI00240F7C0E|nr:methyl jasmonate esterase 1-like [Prosopis cineraria]
MERCGVKARDKRVGMTVGKLVRAKADMEKGKERHFVLVHGACHGAWCWYKLIPLLKSQGHSVTALDLAACGTHPKQVHELSSFAEYVEPLMEFVGCLEAEQRVILVGHSMGGLCISMAMQRFPHKIAAAVFVAAFLPSPHLSAVSLVHEYRRRLDSNMDSKIVYEEGPHANGYLSFGPDFLASKLYNLSPAEDLSLALTLVRPTRLYGDEEVLARETEVTDDKFGSVATVYIVCEQDRVLKPEFQEWMIHKHPNAQHIKVVVSASDHMIMFSNPSRLNFELHHIAATYY